MEAERMPDLESLIFAGHVTQAVATAVELGAIDVLAAGPRPVDAVAEAVGADPDALYRLLRALSGFGFVEERDGRVFALTEAARPLRGDVPGSLRGMVRMVGAPWHRRAWSDLIDCVRTGRSAHARLFGGFAYYRDDPAAGQVFHEAMETGCARTLEPLLRGYDLTRFGTIVDVGGGQGTLLAAALTGHPEGRGVLFDLPYVVARARAVLDRAGVADRCELVGGDFFTAVPPGDVYLLANIVHDWDDEHAVRILRNCAAAMHDGGRVLLFEAVLPEARNRLSPAALIDLEMLVMCDGGRQRTAGELGDLLRRAGLRLTGMRPGEVHSLLEAVPAGRRPVATAS